MTKFYNAAGIILAMLSVVFSIGSDISMADQKKVVLLTKKIIMNDNVTEELANSFQFLNLKGPFWTPVESDINKFEIYFQEFLEKKSITKMLTNQEYVVQFYGVSSDDHRVLYASYFCVKSHVHDDWNIPIIILDGGNCYFRIFFDMYDNHIYGFEVNDEA